MTGDKVLDDHLLWVLGFAEPSAMIPIDFQGKGGLGTLLNMVRFLARRIYDLENPK